MQIVKRALQTLVVAVVASTTAVSGDAVVSAAIDDAIVLLAHLNGIRLDPTPNIVAAQKRRALALEESV